MTWLKARLYIFKNTKPSDLLFLNPSLIGPFDLFVFRGVFKLGQISLALTGQEILYEIVPKLLDYTCNDDLGPSEYYNMAGKDGAYLGIHLLGLTQSGPIYTTEYREQ